MTFRLTSLFASAYSAWALSFCIVYVLYLGSPFFSFQGDLRDSMMRHPCFILLFPWTKCFFACFLPYLLQLLPAFIYWVLVVLHILEDLIFIPDCNGKLLRNGWVRRLVSYFTLLTVPLAVLFNLSCNLPARRW